MRWSEKPYNGPVCGDKRTKEGFLFIPTYLFNPKTQLYEWRWLERTSWTETYIVTHGEDSTVGFWKPEDWVV